MLVLFGLAVLLIVASAACSTGVPVPEEVAAAPAEPTPEDAIEGFLQWYARYPGNPLADGILATNPAVTEGLIEKVDAILASFEDSPGGHDPILCAQDRPQSFSVEVTDRSVDSAAAVVHTEFEGHRIYVGVVKVDGQWMIADVTCPTDPSPSPPEEEETTEAKTPTPIPTVEPSDQEPENAEPADEEGDDGAAEDDPTADWPVFGDEAYGFQIAYPPGWGFMDLPLRDPGVDGPPTIVERFVMFYPQAWEERLKPGGAPDPNVDNYPAFSIQVSVGTMEAYRREFIELGASETLEINGLSVLHEWDTRDDYNLAQYVFQHPANGELRITLTDPVSGFSTRAAENQDIVTLIPQVVSTFRSAE
jgi:hypothetical protein